MGIRQKILMATAGLAIAAAGVAAVLGYVQARSALREASFNRLTAVREMKADQIESDFSFIRSQLLSLSNDPETVLAVRSLREAFGHIELRTPLTPQEETRLSRYYDREFLPRLATRTVEDVARSRLLPADPVTRRLQLDFIADNAFETGSKHLMVAPGRVSEYGRIHAEHHPFFRDFLEQFGYYDVFLIDPETGYIVYSVYKEVDFATSLRSGPYAGTNFARAFEEAVSHLDGSFTKLEDFEPYTPSYSAFASFIASPIVSEEGLEGVLVFQMPVDRINATMTSGGRWQDVGLGETGETYIVADDFTVRNEPRFLIEDTANYLTMISEIGLPALTVEAIASQNSAIGLQPVRTPAAQAALGGSSGADVIEDYRGVEVLSAYRPLGVPDVNWAILSEIDASEAFADADRLRWRFLLGLVLLIPAVYLIAVAVSRSITGPVARLAIQADSIAKGDLETEIDEAGLDEIGDLARRFAAMRDAVKDLVERQNRAIDALATPIIPFGTDTIVLPLVGDLDTRRVVRLRDELSEAIKEAQTSTVLIDMTGVPAIPDDVAVGLQQVVQAASLLGASTTITGIQPDVARTIADLDIDLVNVTTERTLEIGLRKALRQGDGDQARGHLS
jgi:anti-anti-sigma regulatory factor/HAMP domain-containing protein